MNEISADGRKGEILRPKGFNAPTARPSDPASPSARGQLAEMLRPDEAEALYHEGMAAYQHRHWREALERFTRLQELQPARPGLDALIEEVRWFLQLEAAAPPGRELAPRSPGPSLTLAGFQKLLLSHRGLLAALAILVVAATLLVTFRARLPLNWLPWRIDADQEIDQLYNEGQGRLAVGDYEGARAMFQKMLAISPGNEAAETGISLAQRQQRLADAYAAAGAAIAEEDWDRAGIELANVLAVDRDYADAEARAEFVKQQQRLKGLYEDGARLLGLGQWPEAITRFQTVRRLDPGYRTEAVRAFLLAAYSNAAESLLARRGDDIEAVTQVVGYYERALDVDPQNQLAMDAYRLSRWYLDGLQAIADNDRARARDAFVALEVEAPNYANGAARRRLYELALAEGQDALAAGNNALALEWFDRALGFGVADAGAALRGRQLALAVTATPTPTPPPTHTPSPSPAPSPWAIVAAGAVSAYAGPDDAYPTVGQLAQGSEVTITGRRPDGLWLKVCCVDGREGWVAASQLEVSGSLALAPEIIPPTATALPTVAPASPEPTATPELFACISGYVLNSAGAVGFEDWLVTVQEPTGARYNLRTNADGFYRFDDLAVGANILSVAVADGWRAISPQRVTVEVAAAEYCVEVDFWMRPGPPPTPVR
jgi:outer membrane protein assembly factor BamD (BamD/ComL family)